MDNFLAFVSAIAGLVPVVAVFSPLISYIVDAAKRVGLVPNNYAPLASGLLNLGAYAAVFFATDAQRAEFPAAVNAILTVAPFVVALLAGLLTTPAVHDALIKRGIGYSHEVLPKG